MLSAVHKFSYLHVSPKNLMKFGKFCFIYFDVGVRIILVIKLFQWHRFVDITGFIQFFEQMEPHEAKTKSQSQVYSRFFLYLI